MNGPFAALRWVFLWRDKSAFLEGFGMTILVSLGALLLALALGIIFGLFSTSAKKALKGIARVFVEFFQNTPLVVQVFFVYNALPYVGIKLDVFSIGMLCVGIYHGAYVSEVVRAGITSIPRGQMDAARSQGFSYLQAMRYIILPQTVTIVLPPLANQAVNLIKNTSVLALIAGGDLMYRADSWASNGTLSYGPAYIVTGLLYFLLCFPMVTWARRHEVKIKNRDIQAHPAEGAAAGGAK
ncbi:amino acid ABC transporter permease [Leadbettera azotonutricia]|uniref:Polar amino acid ABC transporter, inner membrane subunit n=1 Tax=Leadbettera azotonutricia (strain ATCC BAA-888 / DSM 13862 / ZAS-9) TaxID=545695 RepID=F5YFW9_LEAAZ|nr:amino acid ABC transporter permease [Leadbettera azotonutricia]AEF80138.1 polar amino acid ABC transporter, inner membrane subunit [Leadbettera azotonutricia ZAS-9]